MNTSNPSNLRMWAIAAAFVLLAALAVLGFSWQRSTEQSGNAAKPQEQTRSAQSGASHAERKILYYQDPMHPWIRSDKPGNSPDCGMKLEPVYENEGPGGAELFPGAVRISTARQQLIGVTTMPAEYQSLDKTIRTVGRVAIDETRVANVHVKVSGWIQKVFVDYTFEHVHKGQPLFTLYSPELLAAEEEYLFALKAEKELGASSFQEVAAGGKTLLEGARRRLSLWDLTDDQIRELERTGKSQREITFYAPASGHVLERKAFPNQYVTPDTELYRLVDHSVVWVYADVYESEASFVGLGQEAVLTAESLPGQTLRGQVDFIQPHLLEETRTLPVRMEFANPELKLMPGMFVNVELRRPLGRQLVIPVDAVLDSGKRQMVFVDRGSGNFEPREVKLGPRTEALVAVASGLRAGERVVTRANFLIDSESNLRQAVAGMMDMQHEVTPPSEAPKAGGPEHRH